MTGESRVVVSDLGPTFGMLAFGLDAVGARATHGADGSVEIADVDCATDLARTAARAALAGDRFDPATLAAFIGEDTTTNRHPRAHVCAATLRGGVWFSASQHPPRESNLNVPEPLWAVLLTPAVPYDPRVVTNALPRQIHTHKHARQSALAAGIVRALAAGEYDDVRALYDDAVIGQAVGSHLPGYHPMVEGARRAGALMAGLSGRGPGIGAICTTAQIAEAAREAMADAAHAHSIEFKTLISSVARSNK